ncbi:hypothetical protein EYF80_058608 [Liparis tanakae]|uniref:Uncharacterized protein n=1 Tax=Liparis tanakae TaxID=230148 RepID=A0A4Z2ER07_9TELE|nr:hypothetical protein EYF80_058608 [Liparis tanakae]
MPLPLCHPLKTGRRQGVMPRRSGWLPNTDKPPHPDWARWARWADGLLVLLQCRRTKAGLFLGEPAGSGGHFP